MMRNSPINVIEITHTPIESLDSLLPRQGIPVDFGGSSSHQTHLNQLVSLNVEHAKQQGGRVFLLQWYGHRVPDGAQIGPYKITWTQHGMAHGEDAQGRSLDLGMYERIIDTGPGDYQEMTIILWPRLSQSFRKNPLSRCSSCGQHYSSW